jgi:UDP-2-acetamido-2,6-beta-L-arabino-hexul-4-ose reductase
MIAIIGHKGYIGQNIKFALNSIDSSKLYLIDRGTSLGEAKFMLSNSDVVIHCAGVQRPSKDCVESFLCNFNLTKFVVDNTGASGKIYFVSSIHYLSDTPFGVVRRMEEDYINRNASNSAIFHLPHTFGPFGKPNYNNVFNTFMYNIANSLPIVINDTKRQFDLVSSMEFYLWSSKLPSSYKSFQVDFGGFFIINTASAIWSK